MDAEMVKGAVVNHLRFHKKCGVIALEAYFGDCDIVGINPSGYLIEVEVKTSVGDLKKEAKKRKHKFTTWRGTRHPRTAYFYFALPRTIYWKCLEFIRDNFPDYGVLTVSPSSHWELDRPTTTVFTVAEPVKAKRLTKEKMPLEQQLDIASKQSNTICSLMNRLLNARRALGNGK
ncbi:MAG: hypothetical protein KAR06_02740 [Deltaproteobacteria bacterium]|nr:hypothetical protein [Deltaproteobacteria bacterium]